MTVLNLWMDCVFPAQMIGGLPGIIRTTESYIYYARIEELLGSLGWTRLRTMADTESRCFRRKTAGMKNLIYSPEIQGNAQAVWLADGESRSPPKGVPSCILTFDATNVPLDGHSI